MFLCILVCILSLGSSLVKLSDIILLNLISLFYHLGSTWKTAACSNISGAQPSFAVQKDDYST